LPRAIVFRVASSDPHPSPWIRLMLSAAMGEALYPHPQWTMFQRLWNLLYSRADLPESRRETLDLLLATMPAFAALVVNHRPKRLRGHSLGEAMHAAERSPQRLAHVHRRWRDSPRLVRAAPPTLAFAVLGQARWNGLLTPEKESSVVASLLQHWAVRRALAGDRPAACACKRNRD
jgi:hypothetical protein